MNTKLSAAERLPQPPLEESPDKALDKTLETPMETTVEARSLAERLNEPHTAEVLQRLLDRAESFEQMLVAAEQLPDLLAIAGDTFDEWARELKSEGIELERSVRQGLRAALQFAGQLEPEMVRRVSALARPEVVSEQALETAALAAVALSRCRATAAGQTSSTGRAVPKRLGLLGLLAALRDPDTQRAIAFGLEFAKCFGEALHEAERGRLAAASAAQPEAQGNP